jgi:hypothetical protein
MYPLEVADISCQEFAFVDDDRRTDKYVPETDRGTFRL